MNKNLDPSRFLEPKRQTKEEVNYRIELEQYFENSIGSNVEKLQNFTKYVPCQDIRKYLCRYEIFKKVINIHGSVIECGVLFGGGLMSWAGFSEILEPLNHLRKIIGFDTFEGVISLGEEDSNLAAQAKNGGLAIDSYEDLMQSISLHDKNRLLKHINKVKLVRGDARETIPRYIKDNPHTIVSLLSLDFDVYEPTLVALKYFVPRMPKGAIIVFDELNDEIWPGETLAVLKELRINNLRVERFPFGIALSYAVLE